MNILRPRAGDFRGGAAGAVVGLAQLFTYGLLAFGALGVEQAGMSVRAAFTTAIFGAMTASLLGGTPICGASAKASTTLIFAALITLLAGDPALAGTGAGRVGAILFLGATSLALAGVIQLALGMARLGNIAKYVPYPIVAGFMSGVAILIVLAQVPYLLGLAPAIKGRALLHALPAAHPEPLLIGLATTLLIWVVAPHFKKLPAALIGLVGGTLLYQLAAALFSSAPLGPTLGVVNASLLPPTALSPLLTAVGSRLVLSHWEPVMGTAAALAVIGSLDSLISAAGADVKHNTRHDPNRELIGLGLGNIVSGVFGGIPIAYSPALATAAYRAGARTRWPGLITPLVLLALLFLGAPVLAFVPLAVLAGIMVTVGVGLFDRWAKSLISQLVQGRLAREAGWSLAVVLAVCTVTIVFNFVNAVLFGLVASMGLFIATMSRSLIRGSWTGQQRASRRVYTMEQSLRLRDRGNAIRVLELEGALFFGSVAGLARDVESLAADAKYIILDMRRVGAIEATGAVLLEQLAERIGKAGGKLLLAHVTPEGRLGRALIGYHTFLEPLKSDWYKDVDYALEAAEQALLAGDIAAPGAELPLEQSWLLSGLRPDEIDHVRPHLERHEFAAGEVLFREGEPGDRLYVLTQGNVTIQVSADRGAQRIVTFEPGVIFGEMAMLDGVARSATAVAERRSVAYSLSATALDRIRAADPGLGNRLLIQVGRHLANRLRLLTDMLRAASISGN